MSECLRVQVRRKRTLSTGGRLLVGARIRRTRPSLGYLKLPCWRLRRGRGYLESSWAAGLPAVRCVAPSPPSVACHRPTCSIFCFATSRFIGPVFSFSILQHCRALSLLSCAYFLVTSAVVISIRYLLSAQLIFPSLSHWLSSMFLLVISLHDHDVFSVSVPY